MLNATVVDLTTLQGHLLQGEEYFIVLHRRKEAEVNKQPRTYFQNSLRKFNMALGNDISSGLKFSLHESTERENENDKDGAKEEVIFKLISRSRPASIIGYLGWPLIKRLQKHFFYSQLGALRNITAMV